MSLKNAGRTFGEYAGKVLGSSFQGVGKLAKSETMIEIGQTIEKSTTHTGETIGNLADGLVSLSTGVIHQNEEQIASGRSQIQDQAIRIYDQTKQGLENVVHLGSEVGQGILHNDKQKAKSGAEKLLKLTVAGAFAVGLFEVIDGFEGEADAAPEEIPDQVLPDTHTAADVDTTADADTMTDSSDGSHGSVHHIETINDHLEGHVHPETDVPYESVVVTLPDGEIVEGVFPDFPYEYAGDLPQEMYLDSDDVQFRYMNEQLALSLESQPELAGSFNEAQLAQIMRGETPDGYIWHHTEVPGKMELVDERLHAMSAHDGGRSLWGGGAEFRK